MFGLRSHPRVNLQLAEDSIRFTGKRFEVSFAPAVRVAPDGKLAAVGEESYTERNGELVELFTSLPVDGTSWPQEREFIALCRYALLLSQQSAMLSRAPVVAVVETPFVRRSFGRGWQQVFDRCLRAAGAANVEFGAHAV